MCEVLTYIHNLETGQVHIAGTKEDHSHSRLFQIHNKERVKPKPLAEIPVSQAEMNNPRWGYQMGLKLTEVARSKGLLLDEIEIDAVPNPGHATIDYFVYEKDVYEKKVRKIPWISAEIDLSRFLITDYCLINGGDSFTNIGAKTLYDLQKKTKRELVDAMNKEFPTLTRLASWFDANRDLKTMAALKKICGPSPRYADFPKHDSLPKSFVYDDHLDTLRAKRSNTTKLHDGDKMLWRNLRTQSPEEQVEHCASYVGQLRAAAALAAQAGQNGFPSPQPPPQNSGHSSWTSLSAQAGQNGFPMCLVRYYHDRV